MLSSIDAALALVDSKIVDQATVVGALSGTLIRAFIRWRRSQSLFETKLCVVDALNGATLVPFFFLALSVFSDPLHKAVVGGRSLLALAGLVGLWFVIGQLFGKESHIARPPADSK